MKVVTMSEMIRRAGSKAALAKMAGRTSLAAINVNSVFIDGELYVPSSSTSHWQYCWHHLVEGENEVIE